MATNKLSASPPEPIRLSAIVAVDLDGGIARHGVIPWDLPADRAFFKAQTQQSVVLFGRKTYETLPAPTLPNRIIGVLTHQCHPDTDAVFWATDWPTLRQKALTAHRHIYVAGGQDLYQLALTDLDDIFLSRIPIHAHCDRFFPLDLNDFRLDTTTQKDGFSLEHYVRFACKPR